MGDWKNLTKPTIEELLAGLDENNVKPKDVVTIFKNEYSGDWHCIYLSV